MSRIYTSVTELIGGTPLLELKNIERLHALKARLLAKLEYLNPAGSVKDRIGAAMIEDAEKSGRLKPGGTIIEPTSGNTGIGLAAVAAAKGYKLILTMPETMSIERRKLLSVYGAEIVLTPGDKGMSGAIARAEELKNEIEGSIVAGQFVNKANPAAHYASTGKEIWEDTEGAVDIFIAGVGSGGTISGTAQLLKEKKPGIKVIAVEPATSPAISEGKGGAHSIQGIGAGFIPDNLDVSLLDEVIRIDNEKPFAYARELARNEGIFCGISSGAALCAAVEVASRAENEGKTIVVILPDSGDRYISTPLAD